MKNEEDRNRSENDSLIDLESGNADPQPSTENEPAAGRTDKNPL